MKKLLSLILVFAMVAMTATTAFADTISPFSIFDGDDREEVPSTSGTNYSICKIYTLFDDNTIAYGTGFLISSTKVVTAGHVLHYKNSSGTPKTAKYMEFYFGCSRTNSKPNKGKIKTLNCNSKNIFFPDEWENVYNANYDYGVVKLGSAVSGPSQYFTLGTIDSPIIGKTISITGYEHHQMNTEFSNWQLLQGTGKITDYTTRRLFTQVDGMPGQSGSPVVCSGKVVGIYAYSASKYIFNEPSDEQNGITRMTDDAISAIKSF